MIEFTVLQTGPNVLVIQACAQVSVLSKCDTPRENKHDSPLVDGPPGWGILEHRGVTRRLGREGRVGPLRLGLLGLACWVGHPQGSTRC